jgi:hypothetical protein
VNKSMKHSPVSVGSRHDAMVPNALPGTVHIPHTVQPSLGVEGAFSSAEDLQFS